MKRSICLILAILLTVSAFSFSVSAGDRPETVLVSESVQTLSDGSYILTTVYEEPVQTRATSYSKNGSKRSTFYSASGEAVWEFTVEGLFTVNPGVTSICNSASCSYEIYKSNWSNAEAHSYASGNQAVGEGEFIRKLLGITIERKTCTVTLTCDKNGNLS